MIPKSFKTFQRYGADTKWGWMDSSITTSLPPGHEQLGFFYEYINNTENMQCRHTALYFTIKY